MSEEFIPLADRIILEILDQDLKGFEESAGGLFIPKEDKKDITIRAKVLSVGAGALLANGTRTKTEVSVGDIVMLDNMTGLTTKMNRKKILIVAERNIIAIIRDVE